MVIIINGRKVVVAEERTERVNRALRKQRKNRNIRRELKHAGIGPSFPGNSLAFQTGESYFQTESELPKTLVSTHARINDSAGLNQTVTQTVSRHRKIR